MSVFNLSQNCEFATYSFIRKLQLAVTKGFIQQQLEEHPHYPSMLSISDVLNDMGIANCAYKIAVEKLADIPAPFMAQVKINPDHYFTIVTDIEENTVTYLDPVKNRYKQISFQKFGEQFTGVILLAEATETAGEKHYLKNKRDEKRQNLTTGLVLTVIPALCLFLFAACFLSSGPSSVAPIFFTLLTLAGTFVGCLLLWYEVDQHNPALQQICTAGKNTNCRAILNSKASKIFGISWSVIGFIYFAGSLINLLVTGIVNSSALRILLFLNILALPYIIFSVYYQAKVAKQYCLLCIGVLIILILQFIAGFFINSRLKITTGPIIDTGIVTSLVCFTIPFVIVSILLPVLRKANESKRNKLALLRLKHDPQIFEALLGKQRAVTEPVDGLGIVLGSPTPKYKLLKVCNPYCGPCAKAHGVIDELLENNPDIQVQIMFTATGDENDKKTPPVRHLLAIAGKKNEDETKKALDDWYRAEKRTNLYETFATKYPLSSELKNQGDKIKAMSEWCNKTGIDFTPTFFINGYQLPEIYNVNDLKYFLLA